MSNEAVLKMFQTVMEFIPVRGTSHFQIIQPKLASAAAPDEGEMSEAEWDKFEADINEAFERLP